MFNNTDKGGNKGKRTKIIKMRTKKGISVSNIQKLKKL